MTFRAPAQKAALGFYMAVASKGGPVRGPLNPIMADRLTNDEIELAAIILAVTAFLLGAGFGVLLGGW